MEWLFEDFKTDLESLNPPVREKALEIANELVKEEKYTKKEAITEAIKQAEEWFYDLEG
ncbi:hypothetical protein HC174_12190 [Salinimicrobium sp. CDJ15-81-2]|jgi:uncharacterized protein YdaT|uniref:Uncharacterized protein n=3 Tax=Flavobacteriaceae TaxID=49546 RepID=A0A9X3I1G6_9FLAO|nr:MULTISPECIES: hypothetical protein [Flavobacteriaceae]MDX1601848.1 hypothetical protein [Salinimicrobium sediminis]NJY63506.1 hypothetical protein [Salinimicrobium nanhaiense]MCX2838433.1 hypothetical protein [Salinimicrobium profundisediminis]MDT0647090.1 hypothetical protein [Zunongwangia sp. F260]NJW52169.1 hypothetical protein [Salinimicrobium oceani]